MVKRGHPIRQIRILYLYSFLLFLQPLRHFVPPPLYFCVAKTPRIRGTAREDCDANDFLSQPKKVLVTLICVICSFFSTARRTNQEAPPQLSGFWVRRYGHRRGLRNSFRSDSPRPFSSVSLATSPPDKGGDFARAFAGLFNPSVFLTPSPFGHSPYIPFRNTPPCCGTRQGERRVTSIISTEGLFKISSRRHAPRLSPIFCCVKTLRHAEGNGRGGG